LDIEKHLRYWSEGAHEAMRSVPVLEDGEFWTEALFWTHLAVEKALKAHVVKATQAVPPYIHNLIRLAEKAGVQLTTEQQTLCEDLNLYQRLARYPHESVREPDSSTSRRLLLQAREFVECLLKKL